MKRKPAMPFLVVGIAFLALGVAGQRAFLPIGLVFFVLGVVFFARERRAGGSN